MKLLILGIGLVALSVFHPKQAEAQRGNVSFQVFYDELSPYGQWVDYPNLGYVWLPDVGSDFVPYSTEGQWIYTNYGWTWASNYEWGWAPFHYGRWDFDNNMGWFWLPDNEWGPAWVTWRSSEGYYGWEPMGPGISLSLSFGREYNSHNDHWIFVRDRDFERQDVYRYHVGNDEQERIARNSRIIDNTSVDRSRRTTYVAGPAREDIQRATGRSINQVSIRENSRPGQVLNDRQMRIYRPQVSKSYNDERKPAPARVVNMNEVRRPAERNSTVQPGNQNQGYNRRQQPNNVSPQNSDNQRVRPTQPNNINAPDNNRRQQQRDKIYPGNSNMIQQPQAQPQQPPQQRQQPQAQPQQQRQQPQPQPQPQQQPQQQRQQPQAQPQQQRQQPQAQPQAQPQPPQQRQQPQAQPQKAAPANPSKREQRRNTVKQEKVNRANQAKESKANEDKR